MLTRLHQYADAMLESTWLLALIVAPLFFNVYSQRVFEPDKISLVRTLALFALIAGTVKGFELWGQKDQNEDAAKDPWWRRPLVGPVLALAAAYLLSTLLSVTPWQSFWGSYQRLQGTFTMFSYLIFFFGVWGALRHEAQWRRLQYTIILVSLPIALYGIIQHYRLDPLPWGGDTVERVAGNLGNAIFLAAYLIMAVPLTLERLITATRRMLLEEQGSTSDALTAGAMLFVLAVQLIAILFTQSRGPWIGLAMGLYIFGLLVLTSLRQQAGGARTLHGKELLMGMGMGLLGLGALGLGLAAFVKSSGFVAALALLAGLVIALAFYLVPLFRRQGWRWLWLSFITQSFIVAALVVTLNISPGLLPGFQRIPYVGRLSQLMDFEHGTGRVRVLIWQGVVDMMFRPHEPLTFPDGHQDPFHAVRLLVGYGPESMWVAYNRFYRPELGGLERRNASPDRSHNETFDSLVNTGILGFLAYFALFLSIFYYALKWLGLIADRLSRYLFFILGIAGAVIGALIPWLLGVPEFLGVGLPLGFIVGILLYITYAAFHGSEAIAVLERRHLLLIAILATLVAHFMEIHFGIAIVATRTYAFVLMAALVVLGENRLQTQPLTTPAPVPAPSPKRSGRRKGRKHREPHPSQTRAERGRALPLWRTLLPYALITAAILMVLDWDYVSGQVKTPSPLTTFFKSWFVHKGPGGALVSGSGVFTLVLFTLVVAVVLALGETWRPQKPSREALSGVLGFLAVALSIWFLAGMVFASQITPLPAGTPVLQQAARAVNIIVWFYVLLLGMAALLAAVLAWNDPRPARVWAARPLLSGLSAAALLVLALVLTVQVNINLVRADIYFKIAQGADTRRDWRTSITFYQKALELTPREDYYLLFLGRSFLESARQTQDANQREALFRRAEQILERAQALNPLNTDHTANLARFFGTRANYLQGEAQKEALRKAASYYRQATMLSPHAAHLHNELSTVYARLGEIDKARAELQRSLELDPRYFDTYLRLAQLELEQENWQAAYQAYQRAAELNPRDPRSYSGMAYALAKMGRLDEAIAMNRRVLALHPNDLSALQNLALLYQEQGDYAQALSYARQALAIAPESQKPALQALIAQLEKQAE